MTELLEQMGPAELSDWRADIRALIDKFHKKRRKNYNRSTTQGSARRRGREGNRGTGRIVCHHRTGSSLVRDFDHTAPGTSRPPYLSVVHVLSDGLARHFDKFVTTFQRVAPDDLGDALTDPLAEHAREVFTAGYEHARRNGRPHDDAVRRAANGLARFSGPAARVLRNAIVRGFRFSIRFRFAPAPVRSGHRHP